MSALLAVHQLRVVYGKLHAVQDLDLQVNADERICLIGANGAGKTTLLKAIAGLLPSDGGSVHFNRLSITHAAPHDILKRGIALVPEGRGIFNQMSVAENLALGAYSRSDKLAVQRDIDLIYQTYPRLGERRHQAAGQLSGGEQQLLAVQRALLSRPKLLLLDEPSMGLAPLMVEALFVTLNHAHQQGVALLLVEQNARLALVHSDRAYVMETGRIMLHDRSAVLAVNPAVGAVYLGL